VNPRPEGEDLWLGGGDVADVEVEVELLGVLAAGHVGSIQSSIRWKARAARPSGLSGVTPPPGGLSVAKCWSAPSSIGQPRSPEQNCASSRASVQSRMIRSRLGMRSMPRGWMSLRTMRVLKSLGPHVALTDARTGRTEVEHERSERRVPPLIGLSASGQRH
jgi:hypothetical protein